MRTLLMAIAVAIGFGGMAEADPPKDTRWDRDKWELSKEMRDILMRKSFEKMRAQCMENYDKNKDGKIDEKEREAVRTAFVQRAAEFKKRMAEAQAKRAPEGHARAPQGHFRPPQAQARGPQGRFRPPQPQARGPKGHEPKGKGRPQGGDRDRDHGGHHRR